jgi:hypothetical protein
MWPWSKRTFETSENGATHERAARMQTAVVSCALGPIADISRSGMSVCTQRATGLSVGTELEIELNAPADSMTVRTRVVRVRPLGGGRYELAMEFLGMSEEERTAVENLARHGKRRAAGVFASGERREQLIEALRMPDYYQVLGVARGATVEEIQKAYRVLARKYHPDVCREEGAQQRFCMINDAHDTLGEAEKRAAYDAMYGLRNAA